MLEEYIGEVSGRTFYLCGPGGLCDTVCDLLLNMGVRQGQIRREVFNKPDDVTRLTGWPDGLAASKSVKVSLNNGLSFEAAVNEPLLNSLDRAGISVPSSCHTGECSLCRVRLVSGQVFHSPDAKVRISDQQFGYIHACSAYPTEDIEIAI